MHNQNLIGQLAKKYRASLTNAIRPNISDFLDSVSPEQRDELIRELVPIDVKFRKRNGEFPSIDEYFGARRNSHFDCKFDTGDIGIQIQHQRQQSSDRNQS